MSDTLTADCMCSTYQVTDEATISSVPNLEGVARHVKVAYLLVQDFQLVLPDMQRTMWIEHNPHASIMHRILEACTQAGLPGMKRDQLWVTNIHGDVIDDRVLDCPFGAVHASIPGFVLMVKLQDIVVAAHTLLMMHAGICKGSMSDAAFAAAESSIANDAVAADDCLATSTRHSDLDSSKLTPLSHSTPLHDTPTATLKAAIKANAAFKHQPFRFPSA